MRVAMQLFFLVLFSSLLLFCAISAKKRILITAHRGASGLAPENTMIAILTAIKHQADYAEVDVQETKDGQIVLLHDDDLTRTTNDSGNIWDKNFDELRLVDAGSWKSPEFAGETIPLLSAVIDKVRGKMKLNIELKINDHKEDLERRVVQMLELKNFFDQCVVTSFHRPSIELVKKLNPDIKVGLIFNTMPQEDIFNTSWELLSVHHSLVTENFVKQAHQAGKEVHVWTVDDPELMKKLISYQVDNIITNRPDILLKQLDRM